MKTQFQFLSLLLCSLTLGLYSCSSDDDIIIEEPIESELVLDTTEDLVVLVGEPKDITILEGGGDYNVFALTPSLINIDVNDNVINILAQEIGKTQLIISDKKMNVKKLPIKVVKSKTINIEDDVDVVTFEVRKGNNDKKKIHITNGNNGYKISLDKKDLIDAKVINDSYIELTAHSQIPDESEANITITDQSGIEKTIKVIIKTTTVAFTAEDIENLKNQIVEKEEFFFQGIEVKGYSYTNAKIENSNQIGIFGRVSQGWWAPEYDSKMTIDFKGNREVGKIKDATITYENFPSKDYTSKTPLALNQFEIIKNDGKFITAIFSLIENNVLVYGHIVIKAQPNK